MDLFSNILEIEILLLLNFFISSFLLSLIIITQWVNYPLFFKVPSNVFSDYHYDYVSRISAIVVPIMLMEIIISTLLFILFNSYLTMFIFTLVILIFATTFLVQVPIHDALKIKPDHQLFKKLIATNWIRTGLWFLKFIISFNILLKEIT